MATPAPRPVTLKFHGRRASDAPPSALRADTRAASAAPDPFVGPGVVQVEQVFDLAAPARDGTPPLIAQSSAANLVALEAHDGTTIFIRADRLAEELARLHPGAVAARDAGAGEIDLSLLRDRTATARGLSDWIWSKLSLISLKPDEITRAAREKALEYVQDALGRRATELALPSASWWGAKALMWAIESQLAGEPGLYRWDGGELTTNDRLRGADDDRVVQAAKQGPLLVLIHGTGSHTRGGFGHLPAGGRHPDWVTQKFGDRVFGFEHRTFSESPIDNALQLARALPAGATFSLVTHSRGGLVGDLLCLGDLGEDLIRSYRVGGPAREKGGKEQQLVDADVIRREQATLRALKKELADKDFRIERYVRVACPAHGTRLLSDNLDVFLSGLLSLTNKIIGAVTGPAGAPVLSALKRIVLEIADKRIDPRLVPGIEAMHVGAPMARLLNLAPRKQGVRMAVISGDVEGGPLLQRIGVMFTDWMFFERFDNDLVVDTGSMYGGLAGRPDTRGLFDQGAEVNHFSYFRNPRTRQALANWLTSGEVATLGDFSPVETLEEPSPAEVAKAARERGASRGAAAGKKPVVILVPGIMGSHLALDPTGRIQNRERIWLNPLRLANGGMADIRAGAAHVDPDGLFEMFYGDLATYLEASHEVVRFPYDWRVSIADTAKLFRQVVVDQLDATDQPVRLLAHSMGGLVCRQLIADEPGLWDRLTARSGGRFVMLGTPNQGSHLLVETLLGKSDTIRKLSRVDVRHDLQELLDIVAEYPGALQLLPRPGFLDGGGKASYFDPAVWPTLKEKNRDFWFGDRRGAVPGAAVLTQCDGWWKQLPNETPKHPQQIVYVHGQDAHTACGLDDGAAVLKLLGTTQGDGSVTWASGRLDGLPDDRYWLMPVPHGNLADTAEHFPAIVDLLATGSTNLLKRPPVLRDAGAPATYTYDAPPTPYPTEAELMRSTVGAKRKPRGAEGKRLPLTVSVSAMDLRFAQQPVMCGHYVGDAISGAEALIDRMLVDGELTRRDTLGVYPAMLQTSAIVLNPRSAEVVRRGTGQGAVIVGLGEYGKLSARQLTDTVRAGVVRFLLFYNDHAPGTPGRIDTAAVDLSLMSLLIGHNSTTNITVQASVDAVVRGVCEANRQFADAMHVNVRVTQLEFIEVFLDTAITAAHAVRELPARLEKDLARLNVSLTPAPALLHGKGARPRLLESAQNGYWQRLIVSDADRSEETCPAECYEMRSVSRIPEEIIRAIRQQGGDATHEVESRKPARTTRTAPIASRLRYVFLSERARAETTVQQRQPGLIEGLLANALRTESFDPATSHTLFRHLLPLDFRPVALQAERLVLVVDAYTANLPWEMITGDDQPLSVSIGLIRQLMTYQGHSTVRNAVTNTACVIANPSTEGFWDHFDPDGKRTGGLVSLDGAEREGEAVRSMLELGNYRVTYSPPGAGALDVHNKLLAESYRILVISGHGVVDVVDKDGTARTGVVLSDGLLLTAAEVCLMEAIPQVVFLNCCHLGKMDVPQNSNKLAHSLARELIALGVRCIVVAGWPVVDEDATVFATAFFEAFVQQNQPFGDAVLAARRACWTAAPQRNTWGAYQAYGDPSFVLTPSRDDDGRGSDYRPVSPEELIQQLRKIGVDLELARARKTTPLTFDQLQERLAAELRNAAPAWLQLPQLQFELGELYAQYGEQGFALARDAYLRAIGAEDPTGHAPAPIRGIEQLANLEARAGGKRKDDSAADLVGRAIDRLQHLISSTLPTPQYPPPLADAAQATGEPVNAERWCLLGSAYKDDARVALRGAPGAPGAWAAIEPTLRRAYDAYRNANAGAAVDRSLYAAVNELHLAGLLGVEHGEVAGMLARADACVVRARQAFQQSRDFWDAVMPADLELAKSLLQGKTNENLDALAAIYVDAIADVPVRDRALDSPIRQLNVLAEFFACRYGAADVTAAALREIGRRLAQKGDAGGAPDAAPAAGPVPASPPAPKSPARRGRTATSPPPKRPRRPAGGSRRRKKRGR